MIHADKHGFLAATGEEEPLLLGAAKFMDSNECHTVIPAARSAAGRSTGEVLHNLDTASAAFAAATRERFGAPGEW